MLAFLSHLPGVKLQLWVRGSEGQDGASRSQTGGLGSGKHQNHQSLGVGHHIPWPSSHQMETEHSLTLQSPLRDVSASILVGE